MKGMKRMERQHMEKMELGVACIATLMITEQTEYLLPSVISADFMPWDQWHEVKKADARNAEFHRKTP